MKKEKIPILVSAVIIGFSIFVNIFFPSRDNNEVISVFPEVREWFMGRIKTNISEENAGLELGYLVGVKDELPDGFYNKVKAVGLAHIVVISGMHLSIIITAIRRIFERSSRFLAFYFSLIMLIFYVLLVGSSPSLVRAMIATILSLACWYFGRKKTNGRTVLYVFAISLLVNPYYLTNASFQLSMLAYTGILLILPVMVRYFYSRDKPGLFSSIILTSFSAMITCLPLQLYFFGTFNLISVFANILILPVIPISMGLGLVVGVTNTGILNGLLETILNFQRGVVDWLYDMDEFQFEVSKGNIAFLVIYVLILLWFWWVMRRKRRRQKDRWIEFNGIRKKNIWD